MSENKYSDLVTGMAAMPALRALAPAVRDLLCRTAELPVTERELLSVLTEYRHAMATFAVVTGKL